MYITDSTARGFVYVFRPQYFKLIEECISQIVLHRSGVDPDFRYTKRFEIDVDPLIGRFIYKKRVRFIHTNRHRYRDGTI